MRLLNISELALVKKTLEPLTNSFSDNKHSTISSFMKLKNLSEIPLSTRKLFKYFPKKVKNMELMALL